MKRAMHQFPKQGTGIPGLILKITYKTKRYSAKVAGMIRPYCFIELDYFLPAAAYKTVVIVAIL